MLLLLLQLLMLLLQLRKQKRREIDGVSPLEGERWMEWADGVVTVQDNFLDNMLRVAGWIK